MSESPEPQSQHPDRIYDPAPNEAQLTARAVITGCALGAVISSMNIYFGLKTGWSIGGSLIAAILGFSCWYAIRAAFRCRAYTVLETNITQTAGSAAGSMASAGGLLSSIPALGLLGVDLNYGQLVLWGLAIGYLGVFFAVPLRNQMVVVEKLRFPTGTATAETIVSMFATGSTALAQAKALLWFGLGAALFTLLVFFVPPIGHPPQDFGVPYPIASDAAAQYGTLAVMLASLGAWGFSILLSPLMFGAGIIIGPRVGISLLLGTIIGWGFLGPYVNAQGWVVDPTLTPKAINEYKTGPRGWILWPGVALMVTDAMTNLALSWRTILNTFKRSKPAEDLGMEDLSEQVPNSWWLIGLAMGSAMTVVVAEWAFDIPWWMTLIAIAMSFFLAMIAVRSVGETDINPIGGMGKVTQLVFGGMTTNLPAAAAMQTNLMTAGITAAGASQAGDMMQDLKAGRMLGAAPRKQIVAQCCGIAVGIPVAVGIYKLYEAAYRLEDGTTGIGIDKDVPAPAAHSWKAMAELLSKGFDALPQNAEWAVLIATLVGIAIPVLGRLFKPLRPWLPSGLAMGIAMIVPAYYSIAMFAGSMIIVGWNYFNAAHARKFAIAVASGLIAGEGLMGVVTAVLKLLGVKPWVGG